MGVHMYPKVYKYHPLAIFHNVVGKELQTYKLFIRSQKDVIYDNGPR